MKIIGTLLVIGILLSYVPIIPIDDCPEGHHTGTKKMDCGYSFHCPAVSDFNISQPLSLPFVGRFVLTSPFQTDDELVRLIFHPPEGWYRIPGMKGITSDQSDIGVNCSFEEVL